MKKFLILLAGPPATGKSYLSELIRKNIPKTFIISPDEFKQDLYDNIGFDNEIEKKNLEEKMWTLYYTALKVYMSIGKKFIVTEYPFSYKQKEFLKYLSENNEYDVITIRLISEFEVLWKRRFERDISEERHLGFIVSKYHYGDCLNDRTKADQLITKEEFRKIIELRKYNDFELGRLFEFDVTDYSKVSYNKLIEELVCLSKI